MITLVFCFSFWDETAISSRDFRCIHANLFVETRFSKDHVWIQDEVASSCHHCFNLAAALQGNNALWQRTRTYVTKIRRYYEIIQKFNVQYFDPPPQFLSHKSTVWCLLGSVVIFHKKFREEVYVCMNQFISKVIIYIIARFFAVSYSKTSMHQPSR